MVAEPLVVEYEVADLVGELLALPLAPVVVVLHLREPRSSMIFITAKFRVRPESAGSWAEIIRPFTDATRAEPGCLWFEWSRSLDDPDEYVLVEAFSDGDAGAAHVQSDHFRQAQKHVPPHLVATPKIVSVSVDQQGWSELGEMRVK